MPAEPQHSSGSAISRSSRPGIAAQQRARLGADALGVREVAGVVVGDGHRERVPRGDRAELVEDLRDVADLAGERRGPLGVRRVVGAAARRTPSSSSRSRRR